MAYSSWGYQQPQQQYDMLPYKQPNYAAPSSQYNPPIKSSSSSFGNTSGLGASGWSGGWGGGTTFPGLTTSAYGDAATAEVVTGAGGGTGSNTTGAGSGQQQSAGGGTGQTSPNPDPYGQPWVDYINPDGTPHINYQYGNPYHHTGGGGGGGQGGGGGGTASTYWQGLYPQYGNPNYTMSPGTVTIGPNGQPVYTPMTSGEGDYLQQSPPAGAQGGGGAGGGGGYGLPFTWQQYVGAPAEQRPVAQEWAQMSLPYQQFMQNALQYGMDFTEAQRRWDAQFADTQAQNAFSQGLANRQQTGAEWQAQTAANQWNQQFAHQTSQDALSYGLQRDQLAEQVRAQLVAEGFQGQELELRTQQVLNQNNQYYAGLNQENNQFGQTLGFQYAGLNAQTKQAEDKLAYDYYLAKMGDAQAADRLQYDYAELSQAKETEANRLGFQYAELGQQGEQFGQNLAFQREGLAQERELSANELAYKYWNTGQGNELARWQTGQELGFGREQLQAETQFKYANLQEAARQEAARLGVSVQELMNTDKYRTEQNKIAREELAQQFRLQSRGYGIQEAGQAQEAALARERMAQEARLQQAQLAAQREQAAFAAFGRAQNPNTRWLRVS